MPIIAVDAIMQWGAEKEMICRSTDHRTAAKRQMARPVLMIQSARAGTVMKARFVVPNPGAAASLRAARRQMGLHVLRIQSARAEIVMKAKFVVLRIGAAIPEMPKFRMVKRVRRIRIVRAEIVMKGGFAAFLGGVVQAIIMVQAIRAIRAIQAVHRAIRAVHRAIRAKRSMDPLVPRTATVHPGCA